jgi:capsule polysaccharide modification protein KpsS
MRAADLVITYGSTSGVEAAFAKKPVVVMGPSAYNILGCATQVINGDELRQAMAEPTPGEWSGAVSYGLMMKRRGFNRDHADQFLQVKDTKSLVKNLSMLRRNRAFGKYLATTD